jgi:hypothetical protein
MIITKRQLRRIIKKELVNEAWSAFPKDDPGLAITDDFEAAEELPPSLEERPDLWEIHGELEPVIMRLAGLHGEDPVLGVLESLVSQLKHGL